MLTKEQLELRKTGIGSSDIAAIAGLNPYKGAFDVWLDKTGKAEPAAPTPAMRRGDALEQLIGELYREKRGCTITKGSTVIRPDRKWEIATPDFYAKEGDYGIIVEAKAPAHRIGWGEEYTDDIPAMYITQVHWQMYVTGLFPNCDVAALIGNDFLVYHINYDQELASALAEIAERFWHDYILKDTPPPIDSTVAATDYLHRRYPKNRGTLLIPTTETQNWARQLSDVRTKLTELEAMKRCIENQLIAVIGDADGIEEICTWKKPKDSTIVDWEAIARELKAPKELIDKYTTIKENSRRFLLKERRL